MGKSTRSTTLTNIHARQVSTSRYPKRRSTSTVATFPRSQQLSKVSPRSAIYDRPQAVTSARFQTATSLNGVCVVLCGSRAPSFLPGNALGSASLYHHYFSSEHHGVRCKQAPRLLFIISDFLNLLLKRLRVGVIQKL